MASSSQQETTFNYFTCSQRNSKDLKNSIYFSGIATSCNGWGDTECYGHNFSEYDNSIIYTRGYTVCSD